MNRSPAIILSFLLLWSGLFYGLAGDCCCLRDVCRLMQHAEDHCPSSYHDSGNLKGVANHNTSGMCRLFCGAGEPAAFRLPEFKSKHQILVLPMVLTYFQGFSNTDSPISAQIHTSDLNQIDVLQQISRFLS